MPLDDASRRPLREYWLAEIIRLRETHWGPLEDAEAVRAARRAEGGLPDRILVRAHRLAEREQLPAQLQGWTRSALAVLAALFALALFSGIGLALGALGDGARPVNVLWALGALLGLHALTFLLWLASFLLRPAAATGLGRLWLWVTRKPRAGRTRRWRPRPCSTCWRAPALRWLFGSISHLLWLTGLCAALATLLTVLSTASYRFIWATTLLAPDTFVWLTQAIGWLPGLAGFPPPDAATVLASDGVQTLPAAAQVQWSLWLIGVVVVYGVLPRLAAALLCLVVLRRRLAGLRIDPALPGHAAARPAGTRRGLHRPGPPVDPLHEPRLSAPAPAGLDGRPVLLALELPTDLPWPPATTPAGIQIAGRLDTREERRRILDALADAAASRLLIACDARQTPDRARSR